ncbi:hypothetical protein ACIHEJ_06315 [Streptomyces sp. NPDC052301]|uniref:hypothetical protein n=1 Tax=Streptomyces sp. NPDC052301 TaxID=3365687 RepID=UPI0037D10483
MRSDSPCRVPALALLEAQAAVGGRAFAWQLDCYATVFGGRLGACHGLDVPLVLGAPQARRMLGPEPSREARELSRRTRTAWLRFAVTGDPGRPAYRARDTTVQVLDRYDTLVQDPVRPARELWMGPGLKVLGLHSATA